MPNYVALVTCHDLVKESAKQTLVNFAQLSLDGNLREQGCGKLPYMNSRCIDSGNCPCEVIMR